MRWPASQKIEGGSELRRTWDTFDPDWQRRSSHNTELALYAPQSWLTRSLDADDHSIVEYRNDKERGVFSLALLLGLPSLARCASKGALYDCWQQRRGLRLAHTANQLSATGRFRHNYSVANAAG